MSDDAKEALPAGSTAARFDEKQIRAWMGRVRQLCSRWRSHPDFDDLLATAYLQMWIALQHADERHADHTGLALDGAWHGALKFLASPANRSRRQSPSGNPQPELISLSDWQSLWSAEELDRLPPPVEPDFAPFLVEWLTALEEWRKLPERRREALWLGCMEGLSRKEIIARMGLTREVGYKLLKGLWVLEYTHPGPVEYNESRRNQTK